MIYFSIFATVFLGSLFYDVSKAMFITGVKTYLARRNLKIQPLDYEELKNL